MELYYSIGGRERRIVGASRVVDALESLPNKIIQGDGMPPVLQDGDHILLNTGRLNFLLDAHSIAHQLCVPYQSRIDRLEDARKQAADRYYEQFDFGDDIVADSNGWERALGGDSWGRVVFFENPDGGDSIRGKFYIIFKAGTDEIEDGDYSLEG